MSKPLGLSSIELEQCSPLVTVLVSEMIEDVLVREPFPRMITEIELVRQPRFFQRYVDVEKAVEKYWDTRLTISVTYADGVLGSTVTANYKPSGDDSLRYHPGFRSRHAETGADCVFVPAQLAANLVGWTTNISTLSSSGGVVLMERSEYQVLLERMGLASILGLTESP